MLVGSKPLRDELPEVCEKERGNSGVILTKVVMEEPSRVHPVFRRVVDEGAAGTKRQVPDHESIGEFRFVDLEESSIDIPEQGDLVAMFLKRLLMGLEDERFIVQPQNVLCCVCHDLPFLVRSC